MTGCAMKRSQSVGEAVVGSYVAPMPKAKLPRLKQR